MRQEKRSASILSRMLVLLLLVLLIQAAIYLIVLNQGQVIQDMEQNAFSILNERTANRKLYLENEMVQRWSNTREGELDVMAIIRQVLEEEGASLQQLETDQALCQRVISMAAPKLTAMLRRNSVTGALLVLDCPDEASAYPGFYVRDYDPTSYTGSNDLLMERGLPAIARENAISMDSYWSAFFRFDDPASERSRFYFDPIRAASEAPPNRRDNKYYYRWSQSFQLSPMDRTIITYTLPLVWEDGTVLGVLGVELTTDYLADQLKYQELDDNHSGTYFLGFTTDNGKTYQRICSNGPNFKAYFGQDNTLHTAPTEYDGIVSLASKTRVLYGAVQPLRLYNNNTPFASEQWALIGILDQESVLSFPTHVRTLLFLTLALSFVVGLILIVLAARTLATPIVTLAADLRRSDPDKPIHLNRIHITEIDALTGAIENLSNAAVESAARTSKIIAMTQIPIGVFEYDAESGRVFCSQNLFSIMGWPEADTGDCYLRSADFSARMKRATSNPYEQEEYIYRIPQAEAGDRWIQISFRKEASKTLGAIQDVTHDIEAKRKMEYERDFDILTDLFNRRAFDERIKRLFLPDRLAELKISALLMFDLDNLKYVNDTFGHDYGDRYIQAFAKSLEFFYRYRSVVSRRSGDEFNVFLYGYDSQDEIRALVDQFWNSLSEKTIALPDGKEIKVRASGGMAWYPGDADNYEQLLRLSDFAMYSIKHTVKGAMQEFDRADYKEKGILIHGQEALNRLIDNRLVRYAFQPIVSTQDGSIFGYELLMRPLVEQLYNLGDLFRLAKSESKMYQMERLTWFEAMSAFAHQVGAGRMDHGELAFINSIGGQCLTEADVALLEQRYGDLMSRVVIEFTESEEMNEVALLHKRKKCRDWNAHIALDDYGSGFNGESMLMNIKPSFVKVDIAIIQGIDRDPDKQQILNNLLTFAQGRGIQVLAEGVETYEEMVTVVRAGVHYLQGYYLAKPAFEPPPISAEIVAEIRALRRV